MEEKRRIILASKSPRRKELLERVGIADFKVTAPKVDESVEDGLPPARVVEELSLRKAQAAAKKAGPNDLIIAADTV
ncbi:MAG: Maf family protein, partial [Oscillospiraceae bacterium]|nr:Maf family protein [Oscillospiraceae bacterium]